MRARSLFSVALLVLAGCGSFAAPTDDQLSYAQVQAFNEGLEGAWVLSEYPFARNVARWPNGEVRSLGYWVDDPQGRNRPLMLHFDQRGLLVRKQYGGPHVRPPERSENVGFGS